MLAQVLISSTLGITYNVQLQLQAVPSMNRTPMDETPFDMDTMSMYLPSTTFAHSPPADMWSRIAHQP